MKSIRVLGVLPPHNSGVPVNVAALSILSILENTSLFMAALWNRAGHYILAL